MSSLSPFALKCMTAVLAVQLYAAPAVANGFSISSGGFVFVGSKPLHHTHGKYRVNRYYAAPKVYHYKAKPRVHHVKPVKRHHRSVFGHPKKRYTPYYIPRRYGIKRHYYRRGLLRNRY